MPAFIRHLRSAALAFCALLAAGCGDLSQRPGGTLVQSPAPVENRETVVSTGATPTAAPHDLQAAAPSSSVDLWQTLPANFRLSGQKRPEVAREIDWLKANPGYLARLSRNAQPFAHYVADEVARRGMPSELALLPMLESGYDPAVKSPNGAAGLWQFMGGTGLKLGLTSSAWFDGRLDVVQSTGAALDYLSVLHQQFDGDWLLAIAAYNAGWGTIEKARVKQRRNPSRAGDLWSLDISRESRSLVARLLALSAVVKDPQRYGFSLPAVPDAPAFSRVTLSKPTDLNTLARTLGVDREEFARLNAGWRHGHTGPTSHAEVLVPTAYAEEAVALAERLPASPVPALPGSARASREQRVASREYTVRKGDTLGSIARTQRVTVAELEAYNGLKPQQRLRPGQRLRLERQAAAHAPTRDNRAGTEAHATATRYRVREGDSFWTIARQFKVSIDELLSWNGLKRTSDLKPGQELLVYRPS